MIGEREVGVVIGPMREVKGEVLVSLAPDLADLITALNDKDGDAKSLETGGEGETAGESAS